VVEQQHVAGRDVTWQTEVAHADLAGRPRSGRCGGDQVEALACLELDLAIGEALDPDLRPRQVGKDADLAPDAVAGLAYRLGPRDLRGRVAVREVEADHVDPGTQERVEHARRVGG